MFKRLVIACLLVFGVAIGGAGATDFDAMYDKGPECFMSLDYLLYKGPAPDVWVIASTDTLIHRKYLREGGDVWRGATANREEVLPCCAGKTVAPAWFCPAPEPVPVVVEAVTPMEPKTFVVFFDFDKDVLKKDAVSTLTEAVEYAQEFGYSQIKLVSSCDFRGSDAYNMDLGKRRATAVEHWLIENGISTSAFDVTNNGDRLSPDRFMKGKYCADCWEDRKVEVTVE